MFAKRGCSLGTAKCAGHLLGLGTICDFIRDRRVEGSGNNPRCPELAPVL
jgi:hypothetical protein